MFPLDINAFRCQRCLRRAARLESDEAKLVRIREEDFGDAAELFLKSILEHLLGTIGLQAPDEDFGDLGVSPSTPLWRSPLGVQVELDGGLTALDLVGIRQHLLLSIRIFQRHEAELPRNASVAIPYDCGLLELAVLTKVSSQIIVFDVGLQASDEEPHGLPFTRLLRRGSCLGGAAACCWRSG